MIRLVCLLLLCGPSLTGQSLFFRPVGFDYRSKIQHRHWRGTWDWGLFIGGAVKFCAIADAQRESTLIPL